ncbi:glycosyltransferase [Candidatus Saccharibacteria bacterium]|nr:glycosyltransferase [Candidatus Saccharibacteria bacterium]
MKILIASDLHWPTINGVASFSRNLAQGLAAKGHEVVVIAPSQTGRGYEEYDKNHVVKRTMALPFPFYQNFRISVTPQREVKKIIEDFDPDVIHIQSMLGIGRAALMTGKKHNIPVVATNHAMPENLIENMRLLAPFARPINYILKNYGARFHSNADYLTSPTQSAINLYKDDMKDVSIPVEAVSNGIDLSRFSPGEVSSELRKKYGLPSEKTPIITYLGRLDSEKHLPVMLHAARRVFDEVDGHVLIVGHGNEAEYLKELSKQLGIEKKVTFAGRVSDEDVTKLQKVGSVFCMPSPAELQCIACLEAMASGSPIVVVKAGAVHELCDEGKNGFVCETDNDADMAEKIVAILKDKKLQESMSKRSIEIAKTHDIQHTLARFEAIYQQLIDQYGA